MHPEKPLMLVIDTSVFLHKVYQTMPVEHHHLQFESIIKANLAWLTSLEWLGVHKHRVGSVVFVKDTKPYWRTDWLNDLDNVLDIPRRLKKKRALAVSAKEALSIPAHNRTSEDIAIVAEAQEKLAVKYKGGRKLPTYAFKKMRKLMYGYINNVGKHHVLESRGYEADDLAASLVYTNRENGSPWDILLLTVDTDWLGLGGDDVTWVCMSGFEPVVRGSIEVVNQWAEKRLGVSLKNHRDIWDIKGVQGDASDNLPASAGVLLPVIDLLNPPVEYRYWLKAPDKLATCFTAQDMGAPLAVARLAEKHLRLNGLKPVVKYLPGQHPAYEPFIVPGVAVMENTYGMDSVVSGPTLVTQNKQDGSL